MINTSFIIFLFIKIKIKFKLLLITLKNLLLNKIFKQYKLLFNNNITLNVLNIEFKFKKFIHRVVYQHRINIIFFFFLMFTLYHFFYLSLANQNILCLMYLTLGGTIYFFFSGFIYFIKLYFYNRFTGFIQDFWRLSLTVFWLIEGSLLLVILVALALGPILPYHIYRNELKLGCEYVQYISFESFIIKHLSLLFLVLFTSKEDDEQTSFEQIILVLFSSILITWVLLDEFYLLFHITNVYMRETPTYVWGSKKWILSHSILWRTRMWASYFSICTFTKFLHIIFSAYFILFWITLFFKEGGVSSDADNLEEASDENIKAAANFNLVACYIWISYMFLYPLLNRTIYVFLYNNTSLSNYYNIVNKILKEIILLFY